MKKVAVIIAPGFEEGEALTIVDILRRGQIQCDTIGFEKEVQGGHEIVLRCDFLLDESLLDYDMVVLPGGYGGVEAMKENKQFLSLLQSMNKDHKYICAMCAAPAALEKANLLINKKFTAYQGYENKLLSGNFVDEVAVFDQNIITSQGPATPYPFAFKILEVLGKDVTEMKERLMYNFARGK